MGTLELLITRLIINKHQFEFCLQKPNSRSWREDESTCNNILITDIVKTIKIQIYKTKERSSILNEALPNYQKVHFYVCIFY